MDSCITDEKVFYGDDANFIKYLFIEDIVVPPEVKFSIIQGRQYILRVSLDKPRRLTYADKDGRFWRWRDNEAGLVSVDNLLEI